ARYTMAPGLALGGTTRAQMRGDSFSLLRSASRRTRANRALACTNIVMVFLRDAISAAPSPWRNTQQGPCQSAPPSSDAAPRHRGRRGAASDEGGADWQRSEEHTSELQSRGHLVCRLLLEKIKQEIVR